MHPQTLFIASTIMLGTVTLMVLAVWLFNRKVPGLLAWVVSYALAFFTPLNYLFRAELSPALAHVSIAVLTAGTAYFNLVGSRQYTGRGQPRVGLGLLGLGLLGALVWLLEQWGAEVRTRFTLFSIVAGMLSVYSGWLMGRCPLQEFPYRHLFGWASLLHGVFLMLRPLALFTGHDATLSYEQTLERGQFLILESMVAMLLMSFGVLMLVNEHLSTELRRLAERDPLTELFNRRSFLSLLDKANSLAMRQGQPLSVMIIDLDHFKSINDTLGHAVGDQALRHFVQVAQGCLRKEDVMGRLGGEEFGIFLPGADLHAAQEVAERLRGAVAQSALEVPPQTLRLTASIGVAPCAHHDPAEAALHRADQAMYQAKLHGRNRVELADA